MNKIKFLKQVSSLEKIMLKKEPACKKLSSASVLLGDEFSYQIAYCGSSECNFEVKLKIISPLKEYITVKTVGNVPSELPAFVHEHDDDYLTLEPGLFPDVLYPMEDDEIEIKPEKYHSVWISVVLDKSIKPGRYPITVSFERSEDNIYESCRLELEVIGIELPEQSLIYTQWFHCDCIASYYKTEVFSEEHWNLIDKYMKMASDNGINMLLTPVFTPPLDTKIGSERPTVQLVDVKKNGGNYIFGFEKLIRWINLCKKNNIKYFEISHLFTQWGAKYCPKIMADVEGEYKRIFGWDTLATSDEYKEFLHKFIPELIKVLKIEKINDFTYFHISDEPNEENLDSYMAAHDMVVDLLADFNIMDALSSYDFYKKRLVDTPVCAIDHISPFIESSVQNLWAYYCCGQNTLVSNRFMAMPSYRNRIIATQLYKYDIKGFLQWGYNFYYSRLSKQKINPFLVTDCLNAFPSGDAFSVYPYENGPIESIRLKVFKEALQDLRALQLLERFMSKPDIIALIEENAEMSITFECYPKSADFVLSLREKINSKLKEFISCRL